MKKNIDNRLKNANKQKVEMYRDYLQNILDNFVKNKGFDLQYKVLDLEKTKLVVACDDFESSIDTTKSEIYKKEDFETEEELRKYIYKKAENTAKSVLVEHNNYMQMNNIKAKKLEKSGSSSSLEDLTKDNDTLNINLSYLHLSIFTLLYFDFLADVVDCSNVSLLNNRLVMQFKIISDEFSQYTIKPFVFPKNVTKYFQEKQMESTNKNFKIIADEILKHIHKSIPLSKSAIAVKLIERDLDNGAIATEDIFSDI
ncbi:hypothetical protein ACFJZE_13330 [Enterococcus faecalis]|uniref:hypothetical protein n=1 Tax=Enterococcus faecalis TaxID=1351 RepID=UPI000CF06B7C|nr:hypothetical protein [Enterococcus faecalis]PQC22749.1 hypothetical protein CUM99_14005 [Enterococcus faecalis]